MDAQKQQLTIIAETTHGTPVYLVTDPIPPGLLNMRGRSFAEPDPRGPFAMWLSERFPAPCCVLVQRGRAARIFKLGARLDVFSVTARSLRPDDRKRLVAAKLLPKT